MNTDILSQIVRQNSLQADVFSLYYTVDDGKSGKVSDEMLVFNFPEVSLDKRYSFRDQNVPPHSLLLLKDTPQPPNSKGNAYCIVTTSCRCKYLGR